MGPVTLADFRNLKPPDPKGTLRAFSRCSDDRSRSHRVRCAELLPSSTHMAALRSLARSIAPEHLLVLCAAWSAPSVYLSANEHMRRNNFPALAAAPQIEFSSERRRWEEYLAKIVDELPAPRAIALSPHAQTDTRR